MACRAPWTSWTRSSPSAAAPTTTASGADDLAYILYTSGIDGQTEGRNALAAERRDVRRLVFGAFEPAPDDRFSSHAPFHFDLSVLDIHVCFKHGATLVLITRTSARTRRDSRGRSPTSGSRSGIRRRRSWRCWRSSAICRRLDLIRLRHVLFAGEVFPVKHLRTLCELLARPALSSTCTDRPKPTSARITR